jgi:hypothetical protein
MNERMNEWNECKLTRITNWMNEKLHEWLHEWKNEWNKCKPHE